MNYAELLDKSAEELEKLAQELQNTLRAIRFDIFSKKVYNHREYAKKRTERARVLTALTAKQEN